MAASGSWRGLSRWAVRRPLAAVARRDAATAATAIGHNTTDPYIQDPPPPVPNHPTRHRSIRNAKPFSDFLTDTFHRQHDYLRISVTERCNLRCLYCMPEEGIELSPNKDLLTSAEIFYLSSLFVNQGVNKIRLTGGEPTVRKDIVPLMQQIGTLRRNGLKELALTTNGISLHRKLDAMVEAGLTGVNISLDTLDPFQFQLLTRRMGFDAVMKSINRVQEMNKLGAGIKLKINAVAMRGLNDHQILPFVEKTREEDIEVRFIEYMPFGGNKWSQNKMLPYSEMLDMIREEYPTIERLKDAKNDTSKTWQVPGFKGRIGFITSMTHNFCGTCNRLRITSDGNLKVCLHGNTEVSLRDLLRNGNNGSPMDEAAFEAVRQIELDRRKNGNLKFDGEEGWLTKEQQLLEVIGAAVKRKKAKHAGMGELENMQNRPMILIDETGNTALDVAYPARRYNTTGGFQKPHSRPSIPLHMLSASPISLSHVRWNSSSSAKSGRDEPEQNLGKALETVLNKLSPESSSFRTFHPTGEMHGDEKGVPSVDESHGSSVAGMEERRPERSLAFRAHLAVPGRPRRVTPRAMARKVASRDMGEEHRPDQPLAFRTYAIGPGGRSGRAQPRAVVKSRRNVGTRLTHVDQSGKAHMVDVGFKEKTQRIAIAQSIISFGNLDTFELVMNNDNKKGDVLGVARLAGIMAAKRTSDLIPLCHPIYITKADVELRLVRPAPYVDSYVPKVKFGSVLITTRVECTGQTGVEMEAITAATAAALTVYDMCKATDREMRIHQARLLYKSGGRSGIYVYDRWMRAMGREYFEEHRIEVPEDAWSQEKESPHSGFDDGADEQQADCDAAKSQTRG